MALKTKDNQTCKCGRVGVRLYETKHSWVCGQCLRKLQSKKGR